MDKHVSLNAAMIAGDYLGEAERRYELLSEVFEDQPKLRSQLNPALDKAKAEIEMLRAMSGDTGKDSSAASGKVVAFDADRFRKSG